MPGYRLPEDLRDLMRATIGPVLTGTALIEYLDGFEHIVAVGDVVTSTLIEYRKIPDLAIVDGNTQRGDVIEIPRDPFEVAEVSNPAEMITPELWDAVGSAITRLTNGSSHLILIVVDGEEDLAMLPVVAQAPEGWVAIYGYPGKGAACVPINADSKKAVADALAGFEEF